MSGRTVLLVAVLLVGAALIGYPFASPPGPLRQGIYVEGGLGAPEGLNPLVHRDMVSRRAWGPIFDGLVVVDGGGRVSPGLAESWEVSADGREWTFRLRDNVAWHDGRPFTSTDVVFTVESLAHPAFPGPLHTIWAGRSARRPDEHTVVITLPEPDFGFPYELDLPVVPRHLLAGTPAHRWFEAAFSERPLGTGPYLLEAWDREAGELRYRANAGYFRGRPAVARLVYRETAEPGPAGFFQAGLAGGPISPGQAMAFRMRGYRVYRWPSPWYWAVIFNLREGRPLVDPGFRRAWVEAAGRHPPGSLPVHQPFFAYPWIEPPAVPACRGVPSLLLRPFLRPAAPPGAVTLLAWDQGQAELAIAEQLARELGRAGWKVRILRLPFSELLATLGDPGADWDALVWRWDLVADPEVTDLFHSARVPMGGAGGLQGGANLGGYSNPEVDRLLEAARRTPPGSAQGDLLTRVAAILNHDRAYHFLWTEPNYFAIRREVRGFAPGAFATHWNLWAWRVGR
ncbi:MAG: ABC transporter substrate-binding protein [bacterium]|nr:ABC transporter substrate-binding protein [bacterium]